MKYYNLYLFILLLSTALLSSCKDDDSFDNKVYINESSKVGTILLKNAVVNQDKIIQSAIAQPESRDILITYGADPSLVNTYNEAYYDQAIILPKEHYNLPQPVDTIKAGSVTSTSIIVQFKDLDKLDRDLIYVLPVTVTKSDIDILNSARTMYYVFKGAALINVVADIEENYLHIDQWANPAPLQSLSQITIETLVRIRNYDRMISTVMGIEGKFLIRLGDAGFPSNQIQVATSRGNFPSADSNKGLPTGEWVHIALTYNSGDGAIKIYVNGKIQSEGTLKAGTVNLAVNGVDGFYIGRSYEDSRYLAGDISECRIWNIIRTQEEIANNPYEVAPDTEGLVAYWKCNDGAGNVVKDNTANGNNLTAKSGKDLKWTAVTLPESNK